MSEFRFKTTARMMSQLGDQLIKNERIALLELVKNSYDADADTVSVALEGEGSSIDRIVIEDDGDGMSKEIVENAWLKIGTDYKRKKFDKYIETKTRSRKGRLPIGEKGIGRFGVHKLGTKIEMISKMDNHEEVVVKIDWTTFDDYEYLDDVPIDVSIRESEEFCGENTGTKIIIEGLKSKWSRGMVREAYRSLNALSSPFNSDNSFRVDFKVPGKNWTDNLFSIDDVRKSALYFGKVKINGSEMQYKYEFRPWSILGKVDKRASKSPIMPITKVIGKGKNKKAVNIDLHEHNIGPVYIELMIFNLDSKIMTLGIDDKKGLKDYLKNNGGIKVYRDNLMVYEYGESGNDWLNMDADRINNPSKTLSSRIVVGAVHINRDYSEGLIEKTNREGFIENSAYDAFRFAVRTAVDKIERERRIDQEQLRKYYSPTSKSEPVVSGIAELKVIVEENIIDSKLKKDFMTRLDQIENDYEHITDVFIKSSSSGMSLSIALHEIEKIINELSKAIASEGGSTHVNLLVTDLTKVTSGYANVLRNSSVKNVAISSILRKALFNVSYRLKTHDIEVVNDCTKYSGKETVRCAESLVISSLMNLVDNSIYWMIFSKITKRKLYFAIDDSYSGYLSLIIADNGKGFTIPTAQAEKAFISDKDGGMGLGLYLASEVMKGVGGKLLFPEDDDIELPEEFRSGAVIALAFKEDKL